MKKNLSLILLFLVIITGCNNTKYVYKTYYLEEAFSIVPVVTIMAEEQEIKNLNIEDDLNKILQKLDEKFNVFEKDSLISQVNNNSGIKSTFVDEEFIYVLSTAIKISKETEINQKSLYDVSIYSVWKEWDFNNNYYHYGNYAVPPSSEIIKQKLPLVDYKKIIIYEEHNEVFLKEKGMMVDLGSIVKGYAADKVSDFLKSIEVHNALIDVGGNIVTMGKNIGTNKNWKAGIQMPYTFDMEIGYINTNENKETLVTSGIYERYIVELDEETKTEKKYHHILNPNTGFPENNDLVSVTLVTNNSIIADAYSTALFLMGSKEGMKFVNGKDEIGAVFITKNKDILISENLKNRFFLNEKAENYGYKLIK